MPMLYQPKPLRPTEPTPERGDATTRRAERRRRERLYEIEFFRAGRDFDDDLLGSGKAAALPLDARLAEAIAAASGWVIERYR